MNKELSRQRQWQISNNKAGLCESCRSPLGKSKTCCDKCLERDRKSQGVKRPYLEIPWDTVDWSMRSSQIAKELNVHNSSVFNKRKALNKPSSFKPGRPRKVHNE